MERRHLGRDDGGDDGRGAAGSDTALSSSASISTHPTRYIVLVDDNYHYMDEEERYQAGEYADYERAVIRCKRIVDDFLLGGYKPGMAADDLYESYRGFGEDPFVSPDPPAGRPPTCVPRRFAGGWAEMRRSRSASPLLGPGPALQLRRATS